MSVVQKGDDMKIYFKQPDKINPASPLAYFGITHCYFKQLHIDCDTSKITRKTHHHNSFEIHIIEKGEQEYEAEETKYTAKSGEYFFIPPFAKHKLIGSAPGTEKFSLTFSSDKLMYLNQCILGTVPLRFFENAQFIINESFNITTISDRLIENSVSESIVMFLRLCGLREMTLEQKNTTEDLRLEAVKEYIDDNIESWITVNDIAAYCYLSPKQVTRIFLKHEGVSPAQYIINRRIAHIQKLLENEALSLKSISDKMNFQNEYYFNSFVKKHLGMPPGTYRKMSK